MIKQPRYFERVRAKSSQRWDQLENDPDLAGPWHQLFRQVQSPRHVLSELLQNADDACATEASVCIKQGVFVFGHNGEDFTEEHFGSMCRFGFSNKKSLHTIGFRGIGFKSTFSLGDRVEVFTPTLSVFFYRKRFTEPKWIEARKANTSRTEVRVPINDQHRQRELEKNLSEWIKSPTSLLFFKHIRRIRIEEHEIFWKETGPGPIPNSEWMTLTGKEHQCLLVRSSPEAFPDEALLEIKQERAFNLDDNTEFPPCQVDIVLGAKGRLFVVLPTGVETALSFACNAPFIQDPARLKIKDPEISPTNRWLLDRAGKLAARVMLQWLQNTDLAPDKRCLAYALLPNADRENNSIEGTCETVIEQAFKKSLENAAYLFTDNNELRTAKQSIVLPKVIFDIWAAEDAGKLFDSSGRPAMSRYVSEGDLQKLVKWGVVDNIEKADILGILQTTRPLKPKSWQQLLKLWAYLASEITGFSYYHTRENIQILPVQGKDILCAATDVVRIGEKRLLQSDEDWDFLAEHLLVLNQNWLRYLSEQRRSAETQERKTLGEEVEAAYSVLHAIGFKDADDVSKVCDRVAAAFFQQKPVALLKCIRLTQIAAKLGATVGDAFRFATKDKKLRSTKDTILFDADGGLESLLPASWCDSHLLHPDYSRSFMACNREEWDRWISTGKAGLSTFVPPSLKRKDIWGRPKIEKEVRLRGCTGELSYPYTPSNFFVEDWDFEENHWQHWESLSQQDNTVWGQVVERILAQPEIYWQKSRCARAFQIATTGNARVITYEELLPSWILKLRDLPCLPDTRGSYHRPSDLLRRTPETESFIDVELFIHGRLDSEAVRPLLKLLDVRDTPTGPKRVLDCLRTLAMANQLRVSEVEKWYGRLDSIIDFCTTDDIRQIKQAFAEEKLILTANNKWEQTASVYLMSNEEDVPGAEIIRPSVKELALWRKVDVAERPTAGLAVQWLKGLPSNQTIPQEETNRIRALLTRHAQLIWKECAHWLNLAGEWAPVETLEYSLTMQALVPWKHLHELVKRKTADFQRLPVEISEEPPFSLLPALAAQIEDRFYISPSFHTGTELKPWLNKLGSELRRISLDTDDETKRIRTLAARLEETVWQTAPNLELIPYINGVPAGIARQAEAVWLDKVLYAERRPLPRLARNVAQELGRAFRRQDIGDAIKLCFERSPDFVAEYLEENFKLVPKQELDPSPVNKAISLTDTLEVLNQKNIPEPEGHQTVVATEDIAEEEKTENSNLDAEHTTDKPVHKEEEVQFVLRRPTKQLKPSLIERFAESRGYRKNGEDDFSHADGSWIGKVNDGTPFPWEMRSIAGEIIRYFWTKDICLELEGLQLEADVWGMIDKFPKIYSLVLSTQQDDPVELTGERIKIMREKGEITLYPATYRIVYKSEE